jgi:hypothetical protein
LVQQNRTKVNVTILAQLTAAVSTLLNITGIALISGILVQTNNSVQGRRNATAAEAGAEQKRNLRPHPTSDLRA